LVQSQNGGTVDESAAIDAEARVGMQDAFFTM
jgi:hypothetical protein